MFETLRYLGERIYKSKGGDLSKIIDVIREADEQNEERLGLAFAVVVDPSRNAVVTKSIDLKTCFNKGKYIYEFTHPRLKRKSFRLSRVVGKGKISEREIIEQIRTDISGILSDLSVLKVQDLKFVKDLESSLEVLKRDPVLDFAKLREPDKGRLFYTVGIRGEDDKYFPEYDGYLEYLWAVVRNEKSRMLGTCYVCGEEGEVCEDPEFLSGTPLKLFVTDQKGFLSGAPNKKGSGALRRSFAVCHECAGYIVLGYRYVEKNLTVDISGIGIRIYAFPRTDPAEVEKVSKRWKSLFESIETISKIEESLEDYPITFVFGGRARAHFDLYKIITDVPKHEVGKLYVNLSKSETKLAETFSMFERDFSLRLEALTKIIPLQKAGSEVLKSEKEFVASLFSAMLGMERMSEYDLVSRAVLFAKLVYRENTQGYELKQEARNKFTRISLGLVKWHTIYYFINKKIVENDDLSSEGYSERVLQGLPDAKKGLVYLGMALEGIAQAQMKERSDYTNAPILNVIDFNGMNESRIRLLITQMWEDVKNYRINVADDAVENLSRAQVLINDGKLFSPVENVYYILLGYALRHLTTLAHIKKGGKNE